MSIYATIFYLSESERADGPPPYVYEDSGHVPGDDDPRAGALYLCSGGDKVRLSVDESVKGPSSGVVLDADQVRGMRDAMTLWLEHQDG